MGQQNEQKQAGMSAQHTPAPWNVALGGTRFVSVTGLGYSVLVATARNPADARLIAAAPELLAQAKCVVAMMEKVPAAGDALLPEVRDLFTEINVLRAAIAKATGGAQ